MRQVARTLRRSSLSAEVATTLREMILSGELRADDRLVQDEVAAQLGVSTMPVREALLKLAHEGFVEASPNRSFRIARISRADILDTFWINSMLAGEFAARNATKRNRTLVKALERVRQEETAAVAAHDLERLERLNHEFHMSINEAAGSPRLIRLLADSLRFLPTHLYSRLGERWVTQSMSDHQEIVEAIAAGDQDGARSAAAKHPRVAADMLIAQFTEAGFWEESRATGYGRSAAVDSFI